MEIIRDPIFREDIIDTLIVLTLIIENLTVAIIGSTTTGGMTGILIGKTMVIRKNTNAASGPVNTIIINEPEKVSKIISLEWVKSGIFGGGDGRGYPSISWIVSSRIARAE